MRKERGDEGLKVREIFPSHLRYQIPDTAHVQHQFGPQLLAQTVDMDLHRVAAPLAPQP